MCYNKTVTAHDFKKSIYDIIQYGVIHKRLRLNVKKFLDLPMGKSKNMLTWGSGVLKKSDKSANVFNGLSLRHLAITSNGRNLGGSYMHLGPSINEVVNFSGFLTPQPHVGSFLVLSVGNLDQFLTPSPLPIADVVYGRPLS